CEGSFSVSRVLVARVDAAGSGLQVIGGPLNVDPTHDEANSPSLASVAGVPYVAWHEFNDSGTLVDGVRVARLNADETAFELVGGPLNLDPAHDWAVQPSIAGVDGVPYVAWQESGQVRVARLNASATGFDLVGGPVNADPTQDAGWPS